MPGPGSPTHPHRVHTPCQRLGCDATFPAIGKRRYCSERCEERDRRNLQRMRDQLEQARSLVNYLEYTISRHPKNMHPTRHHPADEALRAALAAATITIDSHNTGGGIDALRDLRRTAQAYLNMMSGKTRMKTSTASRR